MRIDKIKIQNYKLFELEKNNEFTFDPHFTVFIGDNAKGKTSALDALAIAISSFFLGIEGVDSRTIGEKEVRVKTIDGQPKPQKPVVIEAEWNIDEKQKNLWGFSVDKMVWKRSIEKKKTTSKEANEIRDWAASLLKKSRNESSEVVFPILAYLGTGRLWANHEKIEYKTQKEGVKMAYTNALSIKASPKEFLEWFKTQEDAVNKYKNALDVAHLKAFKATITSLVPNNKWQDVFFDYKENELVGVFTTNTGEQEKLKYSQLSDGFRNVIAMAADIAYRCIQLNPRLGESAVEKTPGIVLIDELDLHLHPNWQRRIVGDLKRIFPNIQFIASTHSPFIVQSLKRCEKINLDNSGERFEKDLLHYGVEEIAEIEMNVEGLGRSQPFIERANLAAEYYQLISQGKSSENSDEVLIIRQKLNELEERFSDDPCFIAHLRAERKINAL